MDAGDYNALLDGNFNAQIYQPSTLHELIYNLDSRLVITTNFDKIYERYCLSTSREGFKVVCYDSQSLADELRSDTRLIVKAHGTIDDRRSMIFTRGEYHAAKRDHPSFYEILKAIFLTNTVIFIGCSLDDPDVQLVLEEVKITASGDKPHYILIREGSQSRYALLDWQQTYNVKALEYGPVHEALIEELKELKLQVDQIRADTGV